MASPERLVRAEEDITAIGDTVLDIKATVDTHAETLSGHGRDLADIKATLATITSTLGEILAAIRPAKSPRFSSGGLGHPKNPRPSESVTARVTSSGGWRVSHGAMWRRCGA